VSNSGLKEFACILAFDVKVDADARAHADEVRRGRRKEVREQGREGGWGGGREEEEGTEMKTHC
jgi:hypothetical protein